MLCTMPFSFKVLWSPFVEFYHIKAIGKRKSWIIPTQLVMCSILFYLRMHLEALLIEQQVALVASLLTFLIFVITCQDIAVDSWAVEMLHPCNATYGSSSQSIGQRVGMFVSTSVFISLNSTEFCAKWIYGTELTEATMPVLTLDNYILIWASFQLFITAYIAIFVPEMDPELEKVVAASQQKSTSSTDANGPPSSPRKRGKKKKASKKKKPVLRSSSSRRIF